MKKGKTVFALAERGTNFVGKDRQTDRLWGTQKLGIFYIAKYKRGMRS